MEIKYFFDPDTFTLTYVLSDPKSKDGVVIDPVLDYDQASGIIKDKSAQEVISYIKKNKIKIHALLETHAHADHLSASQILKQAFPNSSIIIGEKIKKVQEVFKNHFNIEYLKTDASQFDKVLIDFEDINFGTLKMKAIPTPGHTPACMSYLFNNEALFVGDALFMPDYGTGRCDFPDGSALQLYQSITKNLYTLPDHIKVFVGHDYSPNGREMRCETTIGESKKNNIQLKEITSQLEFIEFREKRDKTLSAPRLLLPSIQININAGQFPPKENNQKSYLKIPLNPQIEKRIAELE